MIVYKSNYNSPRHSEGIFDARGNPFPCGSKSRAMLCIAKMWIATTSLRTGFAMTVIDSS